MPPFAPCNGTVLRCVPPPPQGQCESAKLRVFNGILTFFQSCVLYSGAREPQMKVAKRALVASAFSAAIIIMTGCGANPHEATEKYILVAANTKLPYWQTALAGLNHAASEMKVKSEMDGPD